jgi:molybdopterin/thiamine biosynthesis adenylyltransferase
VAVVREVLRSAEALIRENAADLHIEDYSVDFSAYWLRGSGGSIQALLYPAPPSRNIVAIFDKRRRLIAENADDGLRWLKNYRGTTVDAVSEPAAFVWLDHLPNPQDYPASVAELRNLVAKTSRDGIEVLDQVISTNAAVSYVILGGKVAGRSSLAAIALEKKPQKLIPGRKPVSHIRGFRPGHAPPQIVALSKTAERLRAERVNETETRLPPEYRVLKEKEVAIIGCGSLGSGVARQLAMAGVGALTLIDPEKLDWANIGRHELGAQAVGEHKVTALAVTLKANFPELREVRPVVADWRHAYAENPNLFDTCSLIVCALGIWNPEVALDDLRATGALPCSVLYGWLENRAAAAHALALSGAGACLRCGFTEVGQPILQATLWPGQNVDPRCGGGISLYGAVDLGFAVSLVSGLALDLLTGRAEPPVWRTWLATASSLTANGGIWNPKWVAARGDPGNGGQLTAGQWTKRADCDCEGPGK